MGYSVKANDIVKDCRIHKSSCGHVRKRGGEPGKYGQVHWEDFDTLNAADQYASTWRAKGYDTRPCKVCSP